MGETILNLIVAAAILGAAAVATQLFARAMYNTCRNCRTLNAKRRVRCRRCGQPMD